ncbi:MAG: ROK family protein [Pseudomonadota bacterium]
MSSNWGIEELRRGGVHGCGPVITPVAGASRPIRQQIFEHVRAAGLVPRVRVAKELGVSPATVTTSTSELIEIGFLEEVAAPREPSDTSRGRPPVALGVRADAVHVAGIKLSDENYTIVVLDFAGNEVISGSVSVERGLRKAEDVLTDASALLDDMVRQAGLDRDRVAAVGLGVPGFVDSDTGRVSWSPVLDARGIDFASLATQRLGIPCAIDNDANVVALAELWFGVGRRKANFAVVTIEHGVGMGFVMNHRLYRGTQGMGLELGHTKVQLDGALCRCGQRGCLEAYVADYALAREAGTVLDWTKSEGQSVRSLIESLYHEAKAGNMAAQTVFRRAGRYLAMGLANVVNLFDPAFIVLSGERMRYDYLYSAETLSEMERLVLETGGSPTPIEVNAWGDLLWAYGAGALALASVTEERLGPGRELAAQ